MSDYVKRTAVDVVAVAFAEAWGEHPNDTRTDAAIAVKALGLEQVGWHAKDPYRFCPMKSALWDCVSDKADYAPVYRVAGLGPVTEAGEG